jgi:hypothetical protein
VTDDPRALLVAALAEPDDPRTALRVLRHAIAWSTAAVSAGGDEPAGEPIELVIALDDALTQVDGLLERVPVIAEQGVAGVPVTTYLRRQAQALAELSDRVAVARQEHEALLSLETELRACAEEHDRTLARVAELKRLERLAESLPAIREQRDRLARRLALKVDPDEGAEQALVDTADEVVTLGAELLADLGERTRDLLDRLAEQERRWAEEKQRYAEEEARLTRMRADYDKLAEEREKMVASLKVHAQIDDDLLNRLPSAGAGTSVERVRSALAEAQRIVDDVDRALADALEHHDRFLEENRRVLPWSSES